MEITTEDNHLAADEMESYIKETALVELSIKEYK